MVTLRSLGAIDLRDAQGNELRAVLVQPRRLALLAALALSRPYGFQRRDRLAALFWPEENDDRARAALSRAIYFLRGHLGDGIIVSRGAEEIGIDWDTFSCDARSLVLALDAGDRRAALSWYVGDLLPAFFASRAPGFEEWLETERSYLRSLAAGAAAALAGSDEAAGRLADAAQWARRAVALAPFDEVAVRQLLRLLDRTGDRAGAVSTYQHFVRELHRELGVTPAPETLELASAIRNRHERLVLESPAAPPPVVQHQPATTATPRRRLNWMALPALGAGLVLLGLFARRDQTIDAFRVDIARLRSSGRATAGRDFGDSVATTLFEGLIQSGVIRTTPSAPLRSGWRLSLTADSLGSRTRRRRLPGTAVSGTWHESHGSVFVDVRVADQRDRARGWTISDSAPPVAVGAMIDRVRQRVAGAVAVLGSGYYASLLPKVGIPPTVEAWREFNEGLRMDGVSNRREAVQRYRLATSLDSAFTWPLVHAAISAVSAGTHSPLSDSVFLELAAAQGRLRPLERLLANYTFAVRANKWEECYHAIRDAARIAPEQFSLIEAVQAASLHRPADAISALTRPVVAGTFNSSSQYWTLLTAAYHSLGEHERELEVVRAARRTMPANSSLMVQELRALAALGLVSEVSIRIDSLAAQPRDRWLTTGAALTSVAEELRAHGHHPAAATTMKRAVAWFRSRPSAEASTEVHRYFMGAALYQAGELDAADTIFKRLERENPAEVDYLGYQAVIAARRGHSGEALRMAAQLIARVDHAPVPGDASVIWRAAVASLLGDQHAALQLLLQEFGTQGTEMLHVNPDFDAMKTVPRYQEFVRPKG